MSTLASTIVEEAQRAINDQTGVRAPASDVVKFLNRAQRDIALVRPDTTAAVEQMTLVDGYRQQLPAAYALLLSLPCNVSSPTKRPITPVDLTLLDATSPTWRSGAKKTEVKHYCYDRRNPRQFYVYPPTTAGVVVEIEASRYPQDIPAPTSPGLEASSVTGNISLADEWSTALLHVVLYYAFLTDLEGLGNVALAQNYRQTAEQLLGTQLLVSSSATKKE